jgi:hypothetical protein
MAAPVKLTLAGAAIYICPFFREKLRKYYIKVTLNYSAFAAAEASRPCM